MCEVNVQSNKNESVLGTVLSYAESRIRLAGVTLTALLICAFSSAVLRADLDLTLTGGLGRLLMGSFR